MQKYYSNNMNRDLFYYFREGLLTADEYRGFLKGNIFKYSIRYNKKGQKKADLEKLDSYVKELAGFERYHEMQTLKGVMKHDK